MSGERAGLILENPYYMGETLNGKSGLDIEVEKKIIEDRLDELKAEKATNEAIKLAMKELGIQRLALFSLILSSSILICFRVLILC